jgi:two-component system chemotaxis response regulator CheB
MTGEPVGRIVPRCAIGVGASAGGVEALSELVRGLPATLEAAVLVVLHIPASSKSMLPSILERHTALPVRTAVDGTPLAAREIVVAPPDHHLLIRDGRVVLDRGGKENGVRPAVDPLFRSMATACGPRAIAVVLSGALRDGSRGAQAVAAAGGMVVVQDPQNAAVASMPVSALEAVGPVAVRVTIDAMGGALGRLAARAPEPDDADDVPA